MEAKFTKGPWSVMQWGEHEGMLQPGHTGINFVRGCGVDVCYMATHLVNGEDCTAADARLIAAAPELYEALMAYRGVKKCGHEFTCVCADDMAAAALKKARGQS